MQISAEDKIISYLFLIGGLILLVFFFSSYYSQRLKIPALLVYMLLGVALGALYSTFELAALEDIANLGIVLLFFLLGLHYPLNHLLNISRRIWQVGSLDVLLNFAVTALIAYYCGFDLPAALIIGGVAYASSSSITIQMLEDTGRSNTPEAEFKVGLLIFEDLVAPVMVSFFIGFSQGGIVSAGEMVVIFLKVLGMVILSVLIALYGFRRLELFVKNYSEKDFMPLLVLGIGFIMAGIALYLGLSKLLGAFLAGVMFAETLSSRQIEKFVNPLKVLTLPFFFFWFGTTIKIDTGIIAPWVLLLLIAWGLIAKSLVAIWGGKIYGLTMQGRLRAAFSLGQRGEFSVVIAALAEPVLRVFCGIYIVVTALAGVLMFNRAPKISQSLYAYLKRRFPRHL